ncbi:MAG TPA: response regulator transcription factor [Acidimicrobiia bacterium]|nr:response regulator transcription factor [Acidimicrobiia bacterium]
MDTIKVVVIASSEASAGRLQGGLDGGSNGAIIVEGSAFDTRSAVELVRRVRPSVTVVDLADPDEPSKSGLATIREVARNAPLTRILALSDSADAEPAVEALTAGAHGVLVQPANAADLVAPVLAVAFGHSVLHRPLLGALVGSTAPREAHRDAELLEALNPQYMELWRMVADGLETIQIAERLYVSERTAKRLVASLLRRLKVANRIQAAALAGQTGLLDDVPAPAPGA